MQIVHYLLQNRDKFGIAINQSYDWYIPKLISAILHGKSPVLCLQVVEELLNAGADVNISGILCSRICNFDYIFVFSYNLHVH